MNTPRSPRDALLARHAAARPVLQEQRDALLARFAAPPAEAAAAVARRILSPRECLAVLWRELFAPCRQAWTALACVWVAVVACQQLDRLTAPTFELPAPRHADPALLALWLEQRRFLAELGARADEGLVSPRTASHEKSRPASGTNRPMSLLVPGHSGLVAA